MIMNKKAKYTVYETEMSGDGWGQKRLPKEVMSRVS